MEIAARRASGVWALVARELWRKTRRRVKSGPSWRWRFAGRTPERVLVAPPDPRPADAAIAADIYAGRFPFAGHLVETNGVSPFEADVGDQAWAEELHGFRWLRHLRAAGTELAVANGRALVGDWIATQGGRIAGLAWEPAIISIRVIAWLQHSTTLLQGAELPFYRSFLKSLALQVRYLRFVAGGMPEDEDRLRVRIALAFAALALPASATALRTATRLLGQEIDRQILSDGGHVSRNPEALLELLADLLPLRQTYANQAEQPSPSLLAAIDRMLPALRFFRHRDGNLARFNGVGAIPADRIAAILRHDDAVGTPLLNASPSGYQRLALGNTTIIADTGAPPRPELSGAAHAGCLAFEMSSGRQAFIVNAGIDRHGPEDYLPLARATAAHSTATLNDSSSCRFNHSRAVRNLIGSPIVNGPRKVTVERTDRAGAQGFVASHDGYLQRFGLIHERSIALSQGGALIEGIDRFFQASGAPPRDKGQDRVALRFHLHPSVEARHDASGLLHLTGKDGAGWIFEAEADAIIEDSIFFASPGGPRRSRQLTVNYGAAERPEFRWLLRQIAPAWSSREPL